METTAIDKLFDRNFSLVRDKARLLTCLSNIIVETCQDKPNIDAIRKRIIKTIDELEN